MIFESDKKTRWHLAVLVFVVIVALAAVLIGCVAYSILTNVSLMDSHAFTVNKGSYTAKLDANIKKSAASQDNNSPESAGAQKQHLVLPHHHNHSHTKPLPSLDSGSIVSAFVVMSDDKSVTDLKTNSSNLNLVIPDYFTFVKGKVEINEYVRQDVQGLLKGKGIMTAARISNTDPDGNWFGEEMMDTLNNDESRAELEDLIVSTLSKYDLKAVNIDIEGISGLDTTHYLDFLDELADKLHEHQMYLTVDVPVNDPNFDYEEIGQISDLVFAMAYDENYENGSAGPIADQSWFNGAVEDLAQRIPKDRLIVAMGQYAYDWNVSKGTPAQSLGFDDTILLAGDVGADMSTDDTAQNSTFNYIDVNNETHTVWLLDGISAWNEEREIQSLGLKGYSLWRLGLEDPSVWKIYGKDLSTVNPSVLENVDMLDTVNYQGEGEILKVPSTPESGKRRISASEGSIDDADYDTLPQSYTVDKYGHSDGKDIVLTFDDGPNPVYTPHILDILNKNNIKATFFVVGQQANAYPDLIKREFNEGHLIGNHTYYHPDITQISPERFNLELNTVQRLIESLTGKNTILFRSPYNTSSTPDTVRELKPLNQAGELGYITVGADIDSDDYERPGVDAIINTVLTQLKSTNGNIIVMHDSGGDRTQTVQALQKLIPSLKAEGYRFVNINDLLNMPREQLMPKMSAGDHWLSISGKIASWLKIYGWDLIVALFFLTTVISVLRIVFLGFFVLKSHKKSASYLNETDDFEPFISILIPAYNEDKVISKTLEALLRSTYKNFEILVIDDGSTDSTSAIVSHYCNNLPNIRLIQKENGGKFSALNIGFANAYADYVVTIDADTIILPDTLKYLIMPFKDDGVDAVCGNVNVGNVKNLITGFQTVEYITTQNYDRRAFDFLNCIGVVPGATGAWKRSKVLESGGYSSETLTEDADLTLTLLEHGARIVYMPYAKSITEAPEKVGTLSKQRFRWSYGTLQTLYKHRKSFFTGTLGWVALPNIFIFQLLFPILSPIGDLVFILSIFRGDFRAILAGYILFLLMDLAGTVMAFIIEKSPIKYLWLVLIQRFFYRQFMYVITYRSVVAAIKGKRHGWNKLSRTNSVHTADLEKNAVP